jgi:hypothetical protein
MPTATPTRIRLLDQKSSRAILADTHREPCAQIKCVLEARLVTWTIRGALDRGPLRPLG